MELRIYLIFLVAFFLETASCCHAQMLPTTGVCVVKTRLLTEEEARIHGVDQQKLYQTQAANQTVFESQNKGMGFLYEKNQHLYVLTCAHVIQGAMYKEIKIRFADKDSFVLSVLGADTFLDLAVLKFENEADEAKIRKKNRFVFPIEGEVNPIEGDVSIFRADAQKVVKEDNCRLKGFEDNACMYNQLRLKGDFEQGMSGSPVYTYGMGIGLLQQKQGNDVGLALAPYLLKKTADSLIAKQKEEIVRASRAYTGLVFAEDYYQKNGVFLEDYVGDGKGYVLKPLLPQKLRISQMNGKAIAHIGDVLDVMENLVPGSKLTIVFGDGTNASVLTDLLSEKHLNAIAKHFFKGYSLKPDDISNMLVIDAKGNQQKVVYMEGIGANDIVSKFYVKDLKDIGVCVRIFLLQGGLKAGNAQQQTTPYHYVNNLRVLYF